MRAPEHFLGRVPCLHCECEGKVNAGYEDAYVCPVCEGAGELASDEPAGAAPDAPEPELIPAEVYACWLDEQMCRFEAEYRTRWGASGGVL